MTISRRNTVLASALLTGVLLAVTATLLAGTGSGEPAPPVRMAGATTDAEVTSATASAASGNAAASDPRESQAALMAVPLSQVRLVRQSLKRSGLGSRVLATFTVRNRHDYPIKDLEVVCAFRGRDGYVTQRRRVLPDVIEARSRERLSNVLVGHINVLTTRGRCKLLAANRA